MNEKCICKFKDKATGTVYNLKDSIARADINKISAEVKQDINTLAEGVNTVMVNTNEKMLKLQEDVETDVTDLNLRLKKVEKEDNPYTVSGDWRLKDDKIPVPTSPIWIPFTWNDKQYESIFSDVTRLDGVTTYYIKARPLGSVVNVGHTIVEGVSLVENGVIYITDLYWTHKTDAGKTISFSGSQTFEDKSSYTVAKQYQVFLSMATQVMSDYSKAVENHETRITSLENTVKELPTEERVKALEDTVKELPTEERVKALEDTVKELPTEERVKALEDTINDLPTGGGGGGNGCYYHKVEIKGIDETLPKSLVITLYIISGYSTKFDVATDFNKLLIVKATGVIYSPEGNTVIRLGDFIMYDELWGKDYSLTSMIDDKSLYITPLNNENMVISVTDTVSIL